MSSSPLNPMDAAISPVARNFRRMQTAASGPLGMSNPELVLSEAEALAKALVFVKAAARAEIARRKREKRDEDKAAARLAADREAQQAELDRRRAEQARYETANGRYVADGLVAMAKAIAA